MCVCVCEEGLLRQGPHRYCVCVCVRKGCYHKVHTGTVGVRVCVWCFVCVCVRKGCYDKVHTGTVCVCVCVCV